MAAAASRVGLRCLRLHRRSRASLQVHDRRDGDLGASQLSLGHAQELGLAPNVGRPQRTHGVLQYLARRLERVREETRQARRHPRIRVCVGCRRCNLSTPVLGGRRQGCFPENLGCPLAWQWRIVRCVTNIRCCPLPLPLPPSYCRPCRDAFT